MPRTIAREPLSLFVPRYDFGLGRRGAGTIHVNRLSPVFIRCDEVGVEISTLGYVLPGDDLVVARWNARKGHLAGLVAGSSLVKIHAVANGGNQYCDRARERLPRAIRDAHRDLARCEAKLQSQRAALIDPQRFTQRVNTSELASDQVRPGRQALNIDAVRHRRYVRHREFASLVYLGVRIPDEWKIVQRCEIHTYPVHLEVSRGCPFNIDLPRNIQSGTNSEIDSIDIPAADVQACTGGIHLVLGLLDRNEVVRAWNDVID